MPLPVPAEDDITLVSCAIEGLSRDAIDVVTDFVPYDEDGRVVLAREGGSHRGGASNLEGESTPPSCAHGIAMDFELQVDLRAIGERGAYVVYTCQAWSQNTSAAGSPLPTCPAAVHFHDEVVSRPEALSLEVDVALLVPGSPRSTLPPSCILGTLGGGWVGRLKELATRLPPLDVYEHIVRHAHAPSGDHFRGWHYTRSDRAVVPPDCPTCGTALSLVIQLDSGDPLTSLWACPDHPHRAHFATYR